MTETIPHLLPVHLLPVMARFIAEAFISGLWQGFLLIAAVAIVLRLVPHLTATVRFAVWGFAFALVVTVPLLHLRPFAGELHTPSRSVHVAAEWGYAIAALWAGFVALRSAQLLSHAIRLRRIWRRASPVSADAALYALLSNCPRPVELCTSADVDSPCVIGFFAPRLLVPDWLYQKLAPMELRQIALHECEHLRRRDDWINLLQKIALVFFPLNPALFWLDRRLGLERELACDAGVVAWTTEPFDYARCLTQLAEHRLERRRVALSLSAWSRQSELARRVHHLLRPVRELSCMQMRFCSALICLGLTGAAAQMAKMPRLLNFSDSAVAPLTSQATMTSLAATIETPVTAPASREALPVAFHEASHPRATLLKAGMPAPDAHRLPNTPATSIKLHKARKATAARPPQLVLTTFEMQTVGLRQSGRHNQTRPINASPMNPSPSYAAVPFGDGWLIVQL